MWSHFKGKKLKSYCVCLKHIKKKKKTVLFQAWFGKNSLQLPRAQWTNKFTLARLVTLLEGCSQEVQGHAHGHSLAGKSPACIHPQAQRVLSGSLKASQNQEGPGGRGRGTLALPKPLRLGDEEGRAGTTAGPRAALGSVSQVS